jgi:transcriptional regulator with XRE-family HTH domain
VQTRSEIREFLTSRRAKITPDQAGLTAYGPRRVPGLRRDELAALAGIRSDYYTRIEQGRLRPSGQVLDALARVLALDETEREHLRRLAHRPPERAPARTREVVADGTHDLLARLADLPALVIGRTLDALAWTPVGGLLLGLDGTGEPNMARRTFLLPESRQLYPEWEAVAAETVAHLRRLSLDRDPRLVQLIGALAVGSTDFARLWGRHEVRGGVARRKAFRHREAGTFELHPHVLTLADSGQTLCVYRAEPGTAGAGALVLLNTLASCAASGPTIHSMSGRGGPESGGDDLDHALPG